uniref:Histone acetyltransferase n=1 Tax=Steinernema glaseri TaxID=37863 RepID=A0A1I7YT54_9BILA
MEDQNNNKVKKAALKNVGASRVVARIKKRKHSPMKTRGLEKKALKETKSPCRVCRMSAGEDIELLKCAKCPVEVHKTKKCIGLTQLDYVVPGKWICPKCTVCHQCGKFVEDAGNRVCYHCGHAFHGACAPKTSSKLDDWLCDMCFPFVPETDDASATSTTSSKTPNRGGRQRKSLNGARQRLPWCPGLQEQRDKIHNNIVDHYKMHHNISFSSDELDPDEPSTSYQDGDFPIATDVDWNLFENAKNYHMSDVYDPPSPEFPIPSDPEDMEQIQYINYFDGRSKCIHQSPYPDEIRNAPEIFVCAFCLRSYHDKSEYVNHANCCKWRHPPGNEIYRDPVEHISIFEVDGILEREYCRQLCLLSKVFLSSKTLYHEVDTFKFYILCEHTTKGFVIRGYFSKATSQRRKILARTTISVAF